MSTEKLLTTDVAIIGTGGAGLAAAIEAQEAGAQVLLVEQAETLGGASIISGGGCFVVGSPLQEARGICDTPDQAFEDWIHWGQGSADEAWARFYIEHSLQDLYFWAELFGVKWVDVRMQEGNRVPRWHRPERNGLGITTALINAAQAKGAAEILTRTEATEILTQNRRVCGLRTVNTRTGGMIEIRSKALVVAAGGFNSNLDMIREVRPDLSRFKIMEGSGRGAQGKRAQARTGDRRLPHPYGPHLVLCFCDARLSRP